MHETKNRPLYEQLGYKYDPAGNLNFRTNHAFVQTFNVDNLNQLSTINRSGTLTVAGNTTTAATNVTVNGLTADRYTDLTYARTNFPLVDAITNFTAIAASSTGLWDTNTVTVDLRATNIFVYDLNGNLRTNGSQILEYDDENRLVTLFVVGVWKSEFVYDGANRRRIQRDYGWTGSGWNQTNETRLIYDGNVVLQHRDANNSPTLRLTRGLDLSGSFQGAGGIGGLLALTESDGTSSYYHSDGGGNVTALINASQLLVAKYLYDPYGNTLGISGPKAFLNPYRFSSKPVHELSGHYDYLYRWYAPDLQRWLNRDPIAEAGGINLYTYVGNSPINSVDPLGLWNLFNPATWGDANAVGWSWTDSLIPWHESSGYTWDGIKKTSFEANAAFWDGANPFGNPYSDLYDAEEMATSCAIGNLTWHVETFLVGGQAFKVLGKGVAGALGTDWAAMTGAQQWIAARGAIPAALWNSGVGGQFVVVAGVVPAVGYLAYNKGTEVIQDIGVIFTPVFGIFLP